MMAEDPCHLFDGLSSLAYSRSDNDHIRLNQLLDVINKTDFGVSPFQNNQEKAVLLVNQLCQRIPATDVQLIKKFLTFFETLLTKFNVTVEGTTLKVATAWCLCCFKTNDSSVILQALKVLQSLVRGKGCQLDNIIERLITVCLDLYRKSATDDKTANIAYNSLKCFEALAVGKDVPKDLQLKCLSIFLSTLYGEPLVKNPVWMSKYYMASLSGLTNLAENLADDIIERLPEVFGAAKGYMLYGLLQVSFKIEKIIPTTISLPEQIKQTPPVKKVKGKYDKKSKKKSVTPITNVENEELPVVSGYSGTLDRHLLVNNVLTSDSDYSDSETGFGGKVRSMQTKVRHCALILLGTLLDKGETKIMTRYLSAFLPDGSQAQFERTLKSSLLKDSSPKCRSEALIVLSNILSKFKYYFTLADDWSRSSFETFSTTIGNTLKELHKTLASALISENSPTVTTHILKAISNLVRCTPYYKLEKGILVNMMSQVKPFLGRKDVNVQVSALTVFGCAASVVPATEESKIIICGEYEPGKDPKPWLFKFCHDAVITDSTNTSLTEECLQVLGALACHHFNETVLAYPDDVILLLQLGAKRDYAIRLYLAKYNETLVQSLQANAVSHDDSSGAPLTIIIRIWNALITGPIAELIQNESPSLRAAGCECISHIAIQSYGKQCSLVYDELPRQNQVVCIIHLFGCAKDEEASVRAAAVRALAVFVLFSSLREDPLFFLDTVDVFFTSSVDNEQALRAQSAWLFGNLGDAALLNLEEGVGDDLEEPLLKRLLEAGLKLAQDSFKVRPNAIRGLGSFLKVVNSSAVLSLRDIINSVIDAIVKNAANGSFMKARWNSCYALGNAMSNKALCAEVRGKALPVLMDLVQNYKNFKVRISAANAIASIPNRSSYGDLYIPVWSAILSALENTSNIADFNEYQHRDQLVDQLCTTLCHLIRLVIPSDIVAINEQVSHSIDQLQGHLQRFKNRVVPEKSSVIVDTDARLGELMEDGTLNAEQRNSLSLLCAIFLTDPLF